MDLDLEKLKHYLNYQEVTRNNVCGLYADISYQLTIAAEQGEDEKKMQELRCVKKFLQITMAHFFMQDNGYYIDEQQTFRPWRHIDEL